jgi:mono/diheme cytochrome c family protein
VEDDHGYGNTSWHDHGLDVEAFSTLPEHRPQVAAQAEAPEEDAPLTAQAERGREVFLRRAKPQCGTCHALQDAEVGMPIGPDLDSIKLPAERIRNAVENGLGVMPSYRDALTPAELDEIAQYVFEARKG